MEINDQLGNVYFFVTDEGKQKYQDYHIKPN